MLTHSHLKDAQAYTALVPPLMQAVWAGMEDKSQPPDMDEDILTPLGEPAPQCSSQSRSSNRLVDL